MTDHAKSNSHRSRKHILSSPLCEEVISKANLSVFTQRFSSSENSILEACSHLLASAIFERINDICGDEAVSNDAFIKGVAVLARDMMRISFQRFENDVLLQFCTRIDSYGEKRWSCLYRA